MKSERERERDGTLGGGWGRNFEDIWAEMLGAFVLVVKKGTDTSVISVRLSACISWGIAVKFGIGDFYEIY